MRQSNFFMPTLKETPADAVAKSHQIMLRGGYIRQVTAGVYAYLPLAYRVLRKTEKVIEEEMAAIKALDKNNRLIKGHVFLWEGAKDWHDLWDEDGVIVK